MEKHLHEKSGSFTHKQDDKLDKACHMPSPKCTDVDVKSADTETENREEETEKTEESPPCDPEYSLAKVSEEIDRFLSTPSGKSDDSVTKEIPNFVEKFLDLVEAKIVNYGSGEGPTKWSQNPDGDASFLEALDRISKLTTPSGDFESESEHASSLNRIGSVLQKAMSFLEQEFRSLLEDSRCFDPDQCDSSKTKQDSDRCVLPSTKSESTGDVDFPGYSNDVVSDLSRIAKAMIKAGYETECCQVYVIVRRNAFEESLNRLGFEKLSIDDVQKMQWESLEREISTWITTFKQCATVYFSGERNLSLAVFSDHPSIAPSLFGNLARGVVIQLLNFAEAVAMTKRSAEKLFKFLDMYETLRDMVPAMDGLFLDESACELKAEISSASCRLGEAAICIFCELENSIKSDTGKTPVPGGAVHPLTRYTMNYLKYACEYKDTLEQVFKDHQKVERVDSASKSEYEISSQGNNQVEAQSPFSVQLTRVMDLLDTNLEAKSMVYKDLALSSIFLMNNGRYILQKIKGSNEIHELMGDQWCRKRSSDLRQYHKNYQRETWSKVLGILRDEGLNVNGKVSKPVLKERFKSFSTMFDEIHRTQSTWVVSDEQLQSELRVSISAVVIPAYRSFLGRFSQHLDPGRQTEKYIKFQPEDIETYIDDLFDGNPASSTGRRKP
ncbi:hypothetical protein L1049_003308 [Liquidambar formosana]|uniref:Exocyst subunit Exo70 family protein n=1 Tax=Liquidambar formosana TaxID=63359 RepID=A0AAP0NMF5_LIQFO